MYNWNADLSILMRKRIILILFYATRGGAWIDFECRRNRADSIEFV